jgi:exonuclease VII small subunit
MSATVTQLQQSTVDPLRVQLRDAIEQASQASTALERANMALQRGEKLASEAAEKFENATTAIAAARERDGQRTARRLRFKEREGGAITPGATRSARANAVEAEDGAAVANAALAQLRGSLVEAEAEARRAGNRVARAVNAVLAQSAGQLLEREKQLRAELLTTWAILNFLGDTSDDDHPLGDSVAELGLKDERLEPLKEVGRRIDDEVLGSGLAFNRHAVENELIEQPWRRWREALRINHAEPPPS